MGMFGKFQKTKEAIYDPANDKVSVGRTEKNGYVDREIDCIVEIVKAKAGRVDNPGSKINKHHYASFEIKLVEILHQSDVLPMHGDLVAEGKPLQKCQPLRVGEVRDEFIKLPRTFHEDPEEYTQQELYMIDDLSRFVGAMFGVQAEAVDLSELDELMEDDGALLKGRKLGYKKVKSESDADPEKGVLPRAYLNTRVYPIDQETHEGIRAMTAEEAEAAAAEA